MTNMFDHLDYDICRNDSEAEECSQEVYTNTWLTVEESRQLKDDLFSCADSSLLHLDEDNSSSYLVMRANVIMLAED